SHSYPGYYYPMNPYPYYSYNPVIAPVYHSGYAPRAYQEVASHSRSWNGIELKDYGNNPFVVNIDKAAKQNRTYRTALWTGTYFQVTLMSINVGDDIGLEVHPTTDQFIRV